MEQINNLKKNKNNKNLVSITYWIFAIKHQGPGAAVSAQWDQSDGIIMAT